MKDKSCKNCNNKNCYIVSDIPFDKRKSIPIYVLIEIFWMP